jgi:hypothetical protein
VCAGAGVLKRDRTALLVGPWRFIVEMGSARFGEHVDFNVFAEPGQRWYHDLGKAPDYSDSTGLRGRSMSEQCVSLRLSSVRMDSRTYSEHGPLDSFTYNVSCHSKTSMHTTVRIALHPR